MNNAIIVELVNHFLMKTFINMKKSVLSNNKRIKLGWGYEFQFG
jgi:hypothetical protein